MKYVSLATVHCSSGASHVLGPQPGALTRNGSARGGTSHSATWSSGSPGPDERRPVPVRAGVAVAAVAREEPERAVRRPAGEQPLLDAGGRVRRSSRSSSGPAGTIRQTMGPMADTGPLPQPGVDRRAVAAPSPRRRRWPALAADHEIGVTQVVSDGPEGDVTYHLQVGDGEARFGAGAAEPEHVRMEQTGRPPSPSPPASSTPRRRSSTATSASSATSSGCSTRSRCSAPSTPCSPPSAQRTEYE